MGKQLGRVPLVWGSEERAVLFRPWWRVVVTLILGVLAVAMVPVVADHPQSASWLGPLSALPMLAWLGYGLWRIAHRPQKP